MKIEAYQQSKDPNCHEVHNPATSSSIYSPNFNSPPNSHTSSKSLDEMELDLFTQINAIFEDAIANPKATAELTTLEMFRLGMNHLRQRRTVVHTERLIDVNTHMSEEVIIESLTDNWGKIPAMVEREVYLYAELLSFIKPYLALPSDQRWVIYKQFVLAFMRFERAYEVYRIFGDNREDTRNIMFNGQPIDSGLTYLKEFRCCKGKVRNRTIFPYVLNWK